MIRILAADDERLALEMLEESIKEAVLDAELNCFLKVNELISFAVDNIPDVVFLDIEMPELNGLTLAEKLKEINPQVNIIFVTGYNQYGTDAMKLFASGYILKPVTPKEVSNVMNNLRYPVDNKAVTIRTFGNFSVYTDAGPVKIRLSRSRELLAYLVDRGGTVVSRREAASILFEDGSYSRKIQNELSRCALWLSEDLEAVGAGDIFIRSGGEYSIDITKVSCDLYDYLNGKGDYYGEYMEQYSWGEFRKGLLEDI